MNFIKIPGQEFEMMDTLVTQGQWQEIMRSNPSFFKSSPDLPVDSVSWNDCQEFIKNLNEKQDGYQYGLPTESQWTICCGSDLENVQDYAWCYENSEHSTHAVKTKKPNEFGFYDMLGNIWEWCEDKWNKDNSGSYRVIRGGNCYNNARDLRSAFRDYYDSSYHNFNVGFRLVRTNNTRHYYTCTLNHDRIAAAIVKLQEAIEEMKKALEAKATEIVERK